jgi:Arc/MetJ family transcription regulator
VKGIFGSLTLLDRQLGGEYRGVMSKTSVEIDRDIADQAAAILGTTTLRDTINASLLEIVNATRRLELVELLGQSDRFAFSAAEDAWGGDA